MEGEREGYGLNSGSASKWWSCQRRLEVSPRVAVEEHRLMNLPPSVVLDARNHIKSLGRTGACARISPRWTECRAAILEPRYRPVNWGTHVSDPALANTITR